MKTTSINEYIENIMHRAEADTQWANDGPIIFNALKSAAMAHTVEKDMLKFLRHHLRRGVEAFAQKKAAKEAAED